VQVDVGAMSTGKREQGSYSNLFELKTLAYIYDKKQQQQQKNYSD